MRRPWILCLLWLGLLAPGVALASPWLQPPGQLVVQLGYVYQSSERQYNVDGGLEAYPLHGGQRAQDASLSVRFGLAEGVEIEAGGSYKSIRYRADLLCLDTTGTVSSADDYRCPTLNDAGSHPYGDLKVVDVAADVQGFGDVYGLFKVRLVQAPVLLSLAPYVKVPTGYRPPGALFSSATDDVALGDGQVDLGGFLFLGRTLQPWRTFLRLDLGYLHRFGAPGDQFVGRFRVGYQVHPRFVVAVGAQAEKTVTPGESIGQQGIRIDPDGTLVIEEVKSERDLYAVDAALIVRASERTEVIVSALKTVGGRYVGDARGFAIGVLQHF